MRRLSRRVSLKTRIQVAVVVMILAGVWGLATRVATVLQADLEKLVSAQLAATVGYMAADIDNKIRLRFDVLHGVSASITPDTLGDPARIQRLLEQRDVPHALFPVGLLVLDNAGVPIADWPRLPGRVGGSGSLRDRAWFHEIMSGRKQTLSAPVVGRFAKQPLVSAAVPILDASGKPAAALVGSIHPSDPRLFGLLEQTKIGTTGYFMVASPKDNLIVSATDKSRIMQPLPARGLNPLLDRRIQEGYEGPGITITSYGEEVLTVSRNMNTTGWFVSAAIPTEEAFAPIHTFQRQIYFAALLLSLVVILVLRAILVRQLAPIEQAGEAMQRMSTGEAPFSPLPVCRDDEIGRMLGNFNQLVAERNRLDQSLRHNEEYLRILFDSLPIAIGHADREQRITFVNRLYRTFYRGAGTPVGRTVRETIDARIYAAAEPHIRRSLAGEEILIERHYARDDGTSGVRSIRYIPDRDSSGEVLGFFVLVEDITERKNTETALQRSEARLKDAQSMAKLGSWELDLVSGSLVWSDQIYRIFEIDPRHFGASYEAFLALIHPEDRANVDKAYTDSLANRAPYSIEHRLLMPDGRTKWVFERCSTDYDASGKALRSIGTVQDITERKQAEEARAQLAAIVENSNDAIISRSLDGTIRTWNAAAERLLGYSAGEAIGRPIALVVPTGQHVDVEGHSSQLQGGRNIPPTEVVRLTKDGRLIDVLRSISPIRNEAGQISGAAVVMRDIGERKRAEAQQRLAASVFDSASEGIVITDKDNNILSVNRAFTEITGYSPEQVIGKNPRMLSSGWQSGTFYDAMWASIRETGRWQGEVWDKRKGGAPYCELLSITAIRNETGEIFQHCAIFSDITRLKWAEAELMRINNELEQRVAQRTGALELANRELESFSYSVSHDLRAPLRSINAFSKIVLEANEGKLDGASATNLKRISAASGRMGMLIDDLLALSQVSRQEMRKQEFDLSESAGQVAESLRQSDPEREVHVKVQQDMKVSGDPGLVRILLQNLIGNAWKFTARTAGPKIEVGLEQRDGESIYFVSDNGAGFDMQYAHRLFNAFERLHAESEFKGTGIGLSIVGRIVARHGGRIWAEAKVGEGATFRFTLA